MADDGLQGITEALRKLDDIGGEQGKFVKKSIRQVLRRAAKKLQIVMLQLIKRGETGQTAANVKLKAAPRSRVRIGMLIGVFDPRQGKFYAGWANFGHRWSRKKLNKQSSASIRKARKFGLRTIWEKTFVDKSPTEKSVGGKFVKGLFWTKGVKAQMEAMIAPIVADLKSELEAIAGRSTK